ncbi:hypothetical protein G6F56_012173 [Rhizopus delemar]|nr:hypothetical protein G6F56_012173 [Rhizopus delemar]
MTASTLFSSINTEDNTIVPNKTIEKDQAWFSKLADQTILEADKFSSSEEEEEDYDDELSESICACGKTLSAGWCCDDCRINCPTCNRALVPEEVCGRCLPSPHL